MSSIIAWFCRKEDLWFSHFSVALSDLYQFTLKQDLNQLIVCHPVITGGAWYLFNALFQMNVVMRWTLSWFCVLFQIKPIFTMTNERWLHRSHSHPIHRLSAEVLEIIFQKVIYYPKKGLSPILDLFIWTFKYTQSSYQWGFGLNGLFFCHHPNFFHVHRLISKTLSLSVKFANFGPRLLRGLNYGLILGRIGQQSSKKWPFFIVWNKLVILDTFQVGN